MMQKEKKNTGLYVLVSLLFVFLLAGGAVGAYFMYSISESVSDVSDEISDLSDEVEKMEEGNKGIDIDSDSMMTEDEEDDDSSVMKKSSSSSSSASSKNDVTDEVIIQKQGGSTVVSLDDEWNLYTNTKDGFKIKIPKKSQEFGGGDGYSDVMVVESPSDSVVGIYHSCGVSRCDEDKRAGWTIYVEDRLKDSEEKLDSFVSAALDSPSCGYDDKEKVDDARGLYRLSGKDKESFGCPRAASYLFYSPEHERGAGWVIGQDAVFWAVDGSGAYDSDMSDSFEFIN